MLDQTSDRTPARHLQLVKGGLLPETGVERAPEREPRELIAIIDDMGGLAIEGLREIVAVSSLALKAIDGTAPGRITVDQLREAFQTIWNSARRTLDGVTDCNSEAAEAERRGLC